MRRRARPRTSARAARAPVAKSHKVAKDHSPRVRHARREVADDRAGASHAVMRTCHPTTAGGREVTPDAARVATIAAGLARRRGGCTRLSRHPNR
jgi:hypothetical protein